MVKTLNSPRRPTLTKLQRNLRRETVAGLPLRNAVCVRARTLLRNVVAQLRSQSLGCAIVVDFESRPLGMFSETSLIKLLADGVDLDTSAVGDYLDLDSTVLRTSDSIEKALTAIQTRGIRFLCVVDDAGHVVGLTGQRGVAEYISEHYPQQVMVQRLGGHTAFKFREGA